MANNCLVTKLSGVVNDDTLEKLGVIRIRVSSNSTESNLIFTLISSKDSTLKTIDTQFVTPYNQSSIIGTENPLTANVEKTFEVLLSTAGYIEIPNKYNLKKITLATSTVIDDVSSLKYSTELEYLYGNGNSLRGDFNSLKDLPLLNHLQLAYSTIVIDANIFTDSNTFVSLQTLNLTGCTNVSNKSAATKTAIETAHPGITVTW